MSFNGETGLALDFAQCTLEPCIGERLDLAAVVADEVMMMCPVGLDGLEAGAVGTDLDPPHVAVAGELLERAVDARDSDPAIVGSKLIEDLLSGKTARLLTQELDDGAAGRAVAVPLPFERGDRDPRPVRGR